MQKIQVKYHFIKICSFEIADFSLLDNRENMGFRCQNNKVWVLFFKLEKNPLHVALDMANS